MLYGGLGSDIYAVDDLGDRVFEANVVGTDLVNSSVSFSLLGQFIENLTLIGSAAINATGNTRANTLIGNSGANRIDGGTNADRMEGKSGNDTYFVQHLGDAVIEAGFSGLDLVNSTVAFSLFGKPIENLTLSGAADVSATGSIYANVLRGNLGDNAITGGRGADDLYSFDGGLDRDRFVYNAAYESGATPGAFDQIFGFDRFNGGGDANWDRIDLSALNLSSARVKLVDLGADVNVQVDANGDGSADIVIQVVAVGALTMMDLLL